MKRRKDKSGMRYGRWTLIEEVQTEKWGTYWLCRCDCGTERVVYQGTLRSRSSQSCGCLRIELLKERLTINELGKRYGHLVVLSKSDRKTDSCAQWVCRCDCGETVILSGNRLRHDDTKSCGCKSGRGREANAFHRVYLQWKQSAKVRGYKWGLTGKEVEYLCQQNCFYCGKGPAQTKNQIVNGKLFLYNGIDRIDNTIGYVSENVVTCCAQCNKAKSTHSQLDFRDWINRVHNHWAGKSSE